VGMLGDLPFTVFLILKSTIGFLFARTAGFEITLRHRCLEKKTG
jgi:UPF0716 family protein affecting phage T7 exclusion